MNNMKDWSKATFRDEIRICLSVIDAAIYWMNEYFNYRHTDKYGGYRGCRVHFYQKKREVVVYRRRLAMLAEKLVDSYKR